LTEKFGVKAELLVPSWNFFNPLSSVTVRMGLAMVEVAEQAGVLSDT
jgi:cysteine synthase